jgi:hypothetical protein
MVLQNMNLQVAHLGHIQFLYILNLQTKMVPYRKKIFQLSIQWDNQMLLYN